MTLIIVISALAIVLVLTQMTYRNNRRKALLRQVKDESLQQVLTDYFETIESDWEWITLCVLPLAVALLFLIATG